MTTANDLINRALRLIGVYSIGEVPSPDESADGLTAFNALLDSMGTSAQLIYAQSLDVISLTASQASVTVGPTGTFVTTRPIQVLDSSYILYQGVVFPLQIWTLADYNKIAVQNIGGIPSGIWPLMEMDDITITPWPIPAAAMTLYLWSNKAITTAPTLATVLSLPPGYDRMLAYMLAVEMAAEYEVEPPVTVQKIASAARRTIKRANVQIPRLDIPYGIPGGNGSYGRWLA